MIYKKSLLINKLFSSSQYSFVKKLKLYEILPKKEILSLFTSFFSKVIIMLQSSPQKDESAPRTGSNISITTRRSNHSGSGGASLDSKNMLKNLILDKKEERLVCLSMCAWTSALFLFIYAAFTAGNVVRDTVQPYESIDAACAHSHFMWMVVVAAIVYAIGLAYLLYRAKQQALNKLDKKQQGLAIGVLAVGAILGGSAALLVVWGLFAALAAIFGIASITSVGLTAFGFIMAAFALWFMTVPIIRSSMKRDENTGKSSWSKNWPSLLCVALLILAMIGLLVWAIIIANRVNLNLDLTRTILPPTKEQYDLAQSDFNLAKEAQAKKIQETYDTTKTSAEEQVKGINARLEEQKEQLAAAERDLPNASTEKLQEVINKEITRLKDEIERNTASLKEQNAILAKLGPNYPTEISTTTKELETAKAAWDQEFQKLTRAEIGLKEATNDGMRKAAQEKVTNLAGIAAEKNQIVTDIQVKLDSLQKGYDHVLYQGDIVPKKILADATREHFSISENGTMSLILDGKAVRAYEKLPVPVSTALPTITLPVDITNQEPLPLTPENPSIVQ
ncbi:hypothetical protein NEHOM01_1293 [Nematocida homosporus]|uniref:uncharacterized protein n=1 Tax=Nematocida homosporus TaxID=1912981 RepID=UPI00221EE7DA|nr:uncharacterized protein NEHOM01_1293 [Nematocida homosporus]KAI5186128.1 hypothetical protein NEHOM01_1293 [Nematocida homosporus]